ncbi:MAG: ferric reductase-like transmembrane domain-containing protein [Patescibacteria group bacterium]
MVPAKKIVFWIFVLVFAYAIVRYNIIRDVPISDIPLFISNKAVALASVIIIGMAFVIGPLTRFFPRTFEKLHPLRKSLGLWGFGLAALHALISIVLLGPKYYSKFYLPDGGLNLVGQSSLLFGAMAFMVFAIVAITSLPYMEEVLGRTRWRSVQRLGYSAYFLVLLHVFIMGFSGWFNPSAYQYGFVSISLLAALVIILVLLLRILVAFIPRRSRR